MKKKQTIENEPKNRYYRPLFLGIPTAMWISGDLYIKFVNLSESQ